MFRNREVAWGAAAHLLVTAVLAGFVFAETGSRRAVILLGAGSLCLLFLWLGIQYRHYQKLRELSAYLKEVIAGDYRLEPLKNQEGELSILKSDIYKLAVNLRSQAELLQKDKGYLADTLSDISHQLKTPMTSLMVMTELLADGKLPEEKRQQFAERIRSQLERMQWLISALLKMSRLDCVSTKCEAMRRGS